VYVSNFKNLPPPYIVDQKTALNWLSRAHARNAPDIGALKFEKLLSRYGCSADKIDRRGSFLRDFAHENWYEMQLFNRPVSLSERTQFFKEILLEPVRKLYESDPGRFKSWVHVTCTGYVSPSLIQILASQFGWGDRIECMHAYHMGCYAAFPALKMARGNLNAEILHTELCTLHLDPANHEPEQLVIQSLFSDGVIRYRVSEDRPENGFEVLELKEVIAAGTLDDMRWDLSKDRFQMTLSREVPRLVEEGVKGLVKRWQDETCVYAIHPGGPRIIDAVKDALNLSEEQVYFSRKILREYGNMSSATLPHVWMHMLDEVKPGTKVISMAFGPGLTLSAGLMRKC
jgi:predicted naringenin-chalcone synthase